MKRLIVLVLALALLPGCFSKNNLSLWPQKDETLSARGIQTIGDRDTDNRILLLDVDGFINDQGESNIFFDVEPTTENVRKKLVKASADPRIKAVVLRINSPGGTVTASDVVYREIKRFKVERHIPVVAMMMDVAASGGYYIACASDRIVAHRSTVTGSIGVIIFAFGFDGLFHKIGMESRVIKSGELKDMGNPFDAFSEEERAVFQHLVDAMYGQFLDVVVENRNIDRERLKSLADGRVYLGAEAKDLGLIDEVGYVDDAYAAAMKLAGIRDAKVLFYTDSKRQELNSYSNNTMKAPDFSMGLPSAGEIMDLARPRMMYMWMGE